LALNRWMAAREQRAGLLGHELAGADGVSLDLAWPDGVQAELTQPAAVLLNETAQVIDAAGSAGFRCFRSTEAFKRYVEAEILGEPAPDR